MKFKWLCSTVLLLSTSTAYSSYCDAHLKIFNYASYTMDQNYSDADEYRGNPVNISYSVLPPKSSSDHSPSLKLEVRSDDYGNAFGHVILNDGAAHYCKFRYRYNHDLFGSCVWDNYVYEQGSNVMCKINGHSLCICDAKSPCNCPK